MSTQLVSISNGQSITTSRLIAQTFGKLHKNVIRSIENLGCSSEFNRLNFAPVEYSDEKGELRKEYQITFDGFTLLAMGFTGAKAMQFKEAYIKEFRRMEQQLTQRQDSSLTPEGQRIIVITTIEAGQITSTNAYQQDEIVILTAKEAELMRDEIQAITMPLQLGISRLTRHSNRLIPTKQGQRP
ncbi:Rha family transcriptional regulator [Thiolinea disciformis]|uniref:Rha family transcriptional regulator n=1 Tax=Thiolinea disciformis TaxID=125614 RepID=UPI00037D700E|nr:Rha family transcriptional regulator [Thiolinea disciformis]